MKKLLVLIPLIIMACGTPSPTPSPTPTETPTVAPSPSQTPIAGCILPDTSGSHVYNPDRLTVIDPSIPCRSVTGTIDFIRHEADGDYHIGLKVDPQFANLPNSCNTTCVNGAEHGDLVVEPVCVLPVTQADAVSSCVGYHNPIIIPPVGSHVEMTGAYVLDTAHGWTELHPLMEVHIV